MFGVLVLSCVVLSCIVSCCTVLLACGVVYCVAFTNLLFKLRLNFRKQSICSKSPPRGNQVDGLPRAATFEMYSVPTLGDFLILFFVFLNIRSEFDKFHLVFAF